MFEKLFTLMFSRETENNEKEKCMTIISENREVKPVQANTQRTCLSKYFYGICGLDEVAKKYRRPSSAVCNQQVFAKSHGLRR